MSKFKVGDKVRLTGSEWGDYLGDIVTITAIVGYDPIFRREAKEYFILDDTEWSGELIESADPVELEEDVVNNPSHYQSASGIEVIDVIEAFDLDRYRSNATKYILRAGNKGDFDEDVRKAVWYLQRLLKWREDHA